MMKRVLLSLSLLAIGVAPALADPRRDGRGPPGMGPRGGYGGEQPDFDGRDRAEGRNRYAGRDRYGDRRAIDDEEDARPRRRPDQDRARDQMRAGAIRPLRDIQQQWRQGMPGYDFLGSDYDPGAGSYRLKFLRGGSVLWIDVDGRTGREIGRRGR